MTDNRLLGADFMRAAACLTVLFHHLSQRMGRADFDLLNPLKVMIQVGTFGVAMFFVLSGFLLARPFWTALDANQPMPSLRTYTIRRAARILPGFWLALVVSFILSFTVFGAKLDGQLIGRFLSGVFLIADWHWLTFFPVEVNGPLWSICFEITCYLLLPLGLAALFLLRGVTGRGWHTRFLWLGVIAIACGLHLLFVRYYPIDNFGRDWSYGLIGGAKYWMPRFNPFAFFLMFAVGALAAGIQVLIARYRNLLFDLISLAAIAATLWVFGEHARARGPEGYGWLGVPYAFPRFELAIALFLAVTPSSVFVGRILDNAVTRYVAQISFGIYIWHNLVIELVRQFWMPDFRQFAVRDIGFFVTACGVIIGLTVLIAHLSFRFLEKPVIDWARGKERSRGAASPTLSPAAG